MSKGIFIRMASRKRKGAILGFDSVNYLLVLIIFVGLGIAGLGALEGYRAVSCKMEMRDITTAISTYNALSLTRKIQSTADLGNLVKTEALGSNDSVDGAIHGAFLKASAKWTESGLKDPWNEDYTFDGTTISSTGSRNSIVGELTETIAAGN